MCICVDLKAKNKSLYAVWTYSKNKYIIKLLARRKNSNYNIKRVNKV